MFILMVFGLLARPAPAANCGAYLGPRAALAAAFMTFSPMGTAQESLPLCEPVVSSEFAREVDIRLPDRIVRIVGHFHPSRVRGEGFEYYFDKILDAPQSFSSAEQVAIRRRLAKYSEENTEAVRQWQEDLGRLEDLSSSVDRVFIEYGEEPFAKIEALHQRRYARGRELLPRLGFWPAQVDRLLTIALTPAYYLANSNPNFTADIATAEGTPFENRAFERQHCPAQSVEDRASTAFGRTLLLEEYLTRLRASLVDRGLASASSALLQLDYGLGAAAARAKDGGASDDDLVDAFLTRSTLPWDAKDLAWIRRAVSLRPWRDWDMPEILRQLPDDLRTYRGCDGRNGVLARNLTRRPGNPIVFMGMSHVVPVAATLARTCRAQVNSSR